MKWAEKTAVITGSGSGIGKAIAIALAKKGVMVHLIDLRQDRITALLEEMPSYTNICGHVVDVTIPEQLEKLAITLPWQVDI